MTTQSKSEKTSVSDQGEQEIVAEFRKTVNMTPGQLQKWLATDESQRVGQKQGGGESVGHRSGERIIELLQKKSDKYSEEDLAHMRKVVSYVRRHLAQGPTKHDPATSDWRYSLMNWGHDPAKD